jgi:putative drug exporter of the RND superfamily
MSAKLPLRIMALIAFSFAVLVVVFGTKVIPTEAPFANVLSIAAPCGVLTAIFQFGSRNRLVGPTGSVPVVSYMPLFMFAAPVRARHRRRGSLGQPDRETRARR